MVVPGRRHVAVRVGQCDPELDAVEERGVRNRRVLGMRDRTTRGHQAQLTRTDHVVVAKAVLVMHLAVEEPAHRLQPEVRMRWHLHSRLVGNVIGSVVVHEAPCADEPTTKIRQKPADDGTLAELHLSTGEQLGGRFRGNAGPSVRSDHAGRPVEIAHSATLRSSSTRRNDHS